MNELISIIVPMYNVEKYLNRCLDSLKSQTYSNIEIIMIDDSSMDSTASIAEYYSREDRRFRLIRQEKNSGTVAAREKGINSSLGDYIMFVDSDDWVHKEYCRVMIEAIESSDADIVQCNYFTTSNNEETDVPISEIRLYEYDSLEAIKQLYGESEKSEFNFLLWNKIYRKEVWSNILHISANLRINDVPYIPIVFSRAKKIVVNNVKLYYYFQRGSLCNKSTMDETQSNYFSMAYEHFRAFRVISDYFLTMNEVLYILTMKYTLIYALSVIKANHDKETMNEALLEIVRAKTSTLKLLPFSKKLVCMGIRTFLNKMV